MEWLRENWFWVVVGVAFIWMHTKMHGRHGAHGGHGGCGGHGGGASDLEAHREGKEKTDAQH
ncbi:MAG: DUF2933 domain-containing protein [Gemmatimonadales bacterium]